MYRLVCQRQWASLPLQIPRHRSSATGAAIQMMGATNAGKKATAAGVHLTLPICLCLSRTRKTHSYSASLHSVVGDDCLKEKASTDMQCRGCGKVHTDGAELKVCGRCKGTKYCSRACQRDDWPQHKASCSRRERRAQVRELQRVIRETTVWYRKTSFT